MKVPARLQVLGGRADTQVVNFQLAHDGGLTALACQLKIAAFRVWGSAMGNTVLVLAFLGPLLGSAVVPVDVPAAPAMEGERWTAVRLAGELRAKDNGKIDGLTAGEEQKTSFEQCLAADEADLCRVLVGAVNVAALIGSVLTSH